MSEKVPEGWIRIDLEDGVSELISGQSPNRKETPASSDAFGILKTTAIDWGKFDESKNQEVLDDFSPNIKHLVKVDDILITKAGPAHRVGVVALARNIRSNVLLSGKMTAIRVNEKLEPSFLAYALCQQDAQNHLKANTTGMASSQTNFTHDALLRVPILLPHKSEQNKIASILTSVDEVIENTQKQIDKLQDLKKATMNELLSKGIGHTEFKDSELGRIPKSWEVKTIEELTSKVIDGPHSTPKYVDSGVPFVTVRNITSGNIEFANLKYITEDDYDEFMRRGKPDLGDILYSKDGSIGHTAIVQTRRKFAYFVSVALLKTKQDIVNSTFLNFALQSGYIWKQTELLNEGSGLKHMVLRSIKSLKIGLPSEAEQQIINRTISSIDRSIDNHRNKLSQTNALKKSLMQDLLTGKVRVQVN